LLAHQLTLTGSFTLFKLHRIPKGILSAVR
jgi:hypothetical protein